MSIIQDKWNDKNIEKLINLIRIHTCLWNSQSDDYKNFEARKRAFTEIGFEMGVDREEARKKYRNLRTQYIREVRNSKTRGYVSRWMHFNALKFLSEGQGVPNGLWDPMSSEDTLEEIERLQNPKTEVCNTDDEYEDFAEEFLEGCEESGDDDELHTVDTDELNIHRVNNVEFERPQPSPAKKKRLIASEISQSEATGCSHEHNEGKKPTVLLVKAPRKLRDEYAIFGEHVANELRVLRNQKKLQNSLKCTILQAILDVNRAANGGLS